MSILKRRAAAIIDRISEENLPIECHEGNERTDCNGDRIVKTNDKESPYLTAVNQLNLIGANCIGVGTTAHDIENIHHINAIAIGVGDAKTLASADYQVVQVGDLRYPMLQKIWEDKQ